jgi:AraC family transcriptional regulator
MLTLVHDGPLPSNEVAPEVAGPLRAAVWYLRHEWSRLPLRRISVAELAIAAHVSRGYLNRLFQATFGSTASAALEHLRCSRADALIMRTDLASLTSLTGSSAIHGISPSAYRALENRSSSVLEEPGVLRMSRLVWDR